MKHLRPANHQPDNSSGQLDHRADLERLDVTGFSGHLAEDAVRPRGDDLELAGAADQPDHDLHVRTATRSHPRRGSIGDPAHLPGVETGDDEPEVDATRPGNARHRAA